MSANSKAIANTDRVFYKRREAAARAEWSVVTLARRERTDPTIPQRVNVGPGDNGPYAYRADEWDAYLAQLPRSSPNPQANRRSSEIARIALAKRRASKAEFPSAERGAKSSTARERPGDAPGIVPLTPA